VKHITETRALPIAHALPTLAQPLSSAAIQERAAAYKGRSVAECYLGPSWLDSRGTACLLIIATNAGLPKYLRNAQRFALIAWRWNETTTAQFSLTVMPPGHGAPGAPQARWFCASEDPAVQVILQQGRFVVAVVNARGESSGWFDGIFTSSADSHAPPSREELERLFTFPVPGIAFSSIHERFDPARRTPYNDRHEDEIPLWADLVVDYWRTLKYAGPWAADLSHRDRLRIAWASNAWHNRYQAAGFIHALRDLTRIDGEPSLFDAQGRFQLTSAFQTHLGEVVRDYPIFGRWFAYVGGPDADAQRAHEITVEILKDPDALVELLHLLTGPVPSLDHDLLLCALHTVLLAGLTDPKVTANGTLRPWFEQGPNRALHLRGIALDLSASVEDVANYWQTGLQITDLIEIGNRIGPEDFPAPAAALSTQLQAVYLEGALEDAEQRVRDLLVEAKEGRQWSIPWGARVQVQFGPFVAMRIFEREQEFSCHFLDDQERYVHVAIGLQGPLPRIVGPRIVRVRDDDGEVVFNQDAEVSLELIGAAIVRDFLVVEERERIFASRSMRRRIGGREIRTIIYLPRVRYSTPHPERLSEGPGTPYARHSVEPHLRRAKKASAAQRFLAQRYGMSLPEGFTFVRAHERGVGAVAEKVRVYRSRSASQMIFDALDRAPEGTRPAWFEFEKDCARLLRRRGMTVIHQAANRDGDGGVDLYAVDGNGLAWVVQCKCWAAHRPVGPDIVRELAGTMRVADSGNERASNGLILTTSTFTQGARELAATLHIDLMDGVALGEELRSEPATGP